MTAPTITSNGGGATATISLAENIAAVTTVTSTDPDAGATKTFSIFGGIDASLFSINSTTGVLTFLSAPDFETPIGGDNSYEVIVRVTDNTAATDDQTITVNITNANEAPVITSNGGGASATIQVNENTTAVTTVTSTDPDAGATMTYSLNGGADASLFNINATTGVLTFLAAKNFEAPGDAGADNTYDVVVRVSDGTITDDQTLQIVLNNVNEAPVITSNGGGATANINIVENTTTPVTTVTSTDVDAGSVRRYSLSGADAAKFVINPVSGVLTFIAPNDFEAPDSVVGGDNVYDVTVTVTDENGLTDAQSLLVTVTNNATEVTIVGSSGLDIINGTVTVAGEPLATTGDDKISGMEGNDIISSLDGNDRIDGGTGQDSMTGGLGNDFYIVDNTLDAIVENGSEGVDTVQSSVTYTLAANIDNLTLVGAAAFNGTGNDLNNILVGNALNNTLDGKLGGDLMSGGAGNDTYIVDDTSDAVIESATNGEDIVRSSVNWTLGANLEDLTLTGILGVSGTGNSLNNDMVGNSGNNNLSSLGGNDTLDGGTGADTMTGGLGNDVYQVDNAGDVVVETAEAGSVDRVVAAVNYTLSAEVENLVLRVGSAAVTGTGNNLNNAIDGNLANNTLSGMDGNDTIFGGGGTDTMIGGNGDDVYYVDNTGDVVTEFGLGGIDTVNSSATFTMGNHVDNLVLSGFAAINGTGNGGANRLTGNGASNTLSGLGGADIIDGALGADTMIGGDGNDQYIVDNAGDITTEDSTVGAGTDLVKSSITTTLQANVENLLLTRSTNYDGTGNGIANALTGGLGVNILTGLAGDDVLDGKGGADTMIGGADNDTYYVDNLADVVTELASEGTDAVFTTQNYTLGNNVENLTIISGSRSGTGNTLNNVITGSTAANILSGLDGNDTISGGAGGDTITGGNGVDTMSGGANNDTFVFTDVAQSGITALTRDTISDFVTGDKINLAAIDANTGDVTDQAFTFDTNASFSTGEVTLTVSGSDTIVSINNDADVTAEMTFIVLGNITMTAADFIL
jgi:Ca2+-binding RTX toxin-like protein